MTIELHSVQQILAHNTRPQGLTDFHSVNPWIIFVHETVPPMCIVWNYALDTCLAEFTLPPEFTASADRIVTVMFCDPVHLATVAADRKLQVLALEANLRYRHEEQRCVPPIQMCLVSKKVAFIGYAWPEAGGLGEPVILRLLKLMNHPRSAHSLKSPQPNFTSATAFAHVTDEQESRCAVSLVLGLEHKGKNPVLAFYLVPEYGEQGDEESMHLYAIPLGLSQRWQGNLTVESIQVAYGFTRNQKRAVTLLGVCRSGSIFHGTVEEFNHSDPLSIEQDLKSVMEHKSLHGRHIPIVLCYSGAEFGSWFFAISPSFMTLCNYSTNVPQCKEKTPKSFKHLRCLRLLGLTSTTALLLVGRRDKMHHILQINHGFTKGCLFDYIEDFFIEPFLASSAKARNYSQASMISSFRTQTRHGSMVMPGDKLPLIQTNSVQSHPTRMGALLSFSTGEGVTLLHSLPHKGCAVFLGTSQIHVASIQHQREQRQHDGDENECFLLLDSVHLRRDGNSLADGKISNSRVYSTWHQLENTTSILASVLANQSQQISLLKVPLLKLLNVNPETTLRISMMVAAPCACPLLAILFSTGQVLVFTDSGTRVTPMPLDALPGMDKLHVKAIAWGQPVKLEQSLTECWIPLALHSDNEVRILWLYLKNDTESAVQVGYWVAYPGLRCPLLDDDNPIIIGNVRSIIGGGGPWLVVRFNSPSQARDGRGPSPKNINLCAFLHWIDGSLAFPIMCSPVKICWSSSQQMVALICVDGVHLCRVEHGGGEIVPCGSAFWQDSCTIPDDAIFVEDKLLIGLPDRFVLCEPIHNVRGAIGSVVQHDVLWSVQGKEEGTNIRSTILGPQTINGPLRLLVSDDPEADVLAVNSQMQMFQLQFSRKLIPETVQSP